MLDAFHKTQVTFDGPFMRVRHYKASGASTGLGKAADCWEALASGWGPWDLCESLLHFQLPALEARSCLRPAQSSRGGGSVWVQGGHLLSPFPGGLHVSSLKCLALLAWDLRAESKASHLPPGVGRTSPPA